MLRGWLFSDILRGRTVYCLASPFSSMASRVTFGSDGRGDVDGPVTTGAGEGPTGRGGDPMDRGECPIGGGEGPLGGGGDPMDRGECPMGGGEGSMEEVSPMDGGEGPMWLDCGAVKRDSWVRGANLGLNGTGSGLGSDSALECARPVSDCLYMYGSVGVTGSFLPPILAGALWYEGAWTGLRPRGLSVSSNDTAFFFSFLVVGSVMESYSS